MIFNETKLTNAYVIDLDTKNDERGYFVRTYDIELFRKHGIDCPIVQTNLSFNKHKHTLRGMHYQAKPHQEAKMVTCLRGAFFDVIIDLRVNSSTYKQWFGIELNEKNNRILYIPRDFAHGFLTLQDETLIGYKVSEFYTPGAGKGFKYDDPAFDIDWPAKAEIISKKDQEWLPFNAKKM